GVPRGATRLEATSGDAGRRGGPRPRRARAERRPRLDPGGTRAGIVHPRPPDARAVVRGDRRGGGAVCGAGGRACAYSDQPSRPAGTRRARVGGGGSASTADLAGLLGRLAARWRLTSFSAACL